MSQWIYGRRTVEEVLKAGNSAKRMIVVEGMLPGSAKELLRLAAQQQIPCQRVTRRALDAMVRGNHQGVALEVQEVAAPDFKSFLSELGGKKNAFVCLLDEVQDPQNLGAIIRSAACFECSGVVVPSWRSAKVTEGVLKASSGAAAHIPVVEIANLTVAVERLKENGFFIYGADASAEATLDKAELAFPLALIFGNEHRGIKPILKKNCDQLLRIQQGPAVASLNVSAAAAVFFYEISKKMRKGG